MGSQSDSESDFGSPVRKKRKSDNAGIYEDEDDEEVSGSDDSQSNFENGSDSISSSGVNKRKHESDGEIENKKSKHERIEGAEESIEKDKDNGKSQFGSENDTDSENSISKNSQFGSGNDSDSLSSPLKKKDDDIQVYKSLLEDKEKENAELISEKITLKIQVKEKERELKSKDEAIESLTSDA